MSTTTMKNEITNGKATCCCFPASPKRMAKGPFDVESGSADSCDTIIARQLELLRRARRAVRAGTEGEACLESCVQGCHLLK